MTPLEGQPQVAAENGETDDGQRRWRTSLAI